MVFSPIGLGLKRSASAATLPVGETGVSKGKGGQSGGDHPPGKGALKARVGRAMTTVVVTKILLARKTGDTAQAGIGLVFTLALARAAWSPSMSFFN